MSKKQPIQSLNKENTTKKALTQCVLVICKYLNNNKLTCVQCVLNG